MLGFGRRSAPAIWDRRAVIVAGGILVAHLLMDHASAQPFRCQDPVIRDGEVVEIGQTTITIHEWAGEYTYRIDQTELWKLEANQIGLGDKVQFLACRAGEIAKNFKKM